MGVDSGVFPIYSATANWASNIFPGATAFNVPIIIRIQIFLNGKGIAMIIRAEIQSALYNPNNEIHKTKVKKELNLQKEKEERGGDKWAPREWQDD